MGTFHTSSAVGALAVGAVAVASLQAPKMSKARGFESHSGHLLELYPLVMTNVAIENGH